jgi:hypothetical protein
MKRFNKILIMTFSLAFLMFACKEDDVTPDNNSKEKKPPYLDYKSATDYWFPKERGDSIIPVVDVNGAYDATVAEGGEWCTVSEIAVHSFRINYDENKKAEDRTTTITLSLDGVEDINIVVSQRGPDVVFVPDSLALTEDPLLEALTIAAPFLGGNTVVPIRSNCNYTVGIEGGTGWCSVADITETGLNLATVANNGTDGRSARVSITHSYQGVSVRFEFVVTQAASPIVLNSPEDGGVIKKLDGFPYTFEWRKTGGVPGYTISVSASTDFPEGATFSKAVGDNDKYDLQLNDIADMIGRWEAKMPLYWKVTATDPSFNIAIQTQRFYVLRNLVSSSPLTLNGGDSSWTGLSDDEEGYPRMGLNGGRSSRRVFMAINPTTVAIPEEKVVAVAYDYKTTMIASYPGDALQVYHFVDNPYAWTGLIISPCTNEWLPQIFSLRTLRSDWGSVAGNKFYFFIMPNPVTADDQYPGSYFHFKDLRLEVYDE